MSNVDISVIIPTKNGEKTIEKCLAKINSQKTNRKIEIIAIDSGSKDKTLEILKKFNCKIINISPIDFTHGFSRNLGAKSATGEFLVFINQDAIPYNEFWLENLIQPLNDSVVATYSKQIPYPDCITVEKVFLDYVYPNNPRIININSLKERNMSESILFSTVSGAIRKNVFSKFTFSEEILMTEDQELAVRLLKSDFCIEYLPSSIVTHSHSYTINQVLKRYFDSGWTISLIKDIGKFTIKKTTKEQWTLLCKSVKTAYQQEGVKSAIHTICYFTVKSFGFFLGTKAESFPKCIRNNLSHTLNLKKK